MTPPSIDGDPLDWEPPNPALQSWEEIEDRPYPGALATNTLRTEYRQLQAAGYEGDVNGEIADPDVQDSALARARRIWQFLERREDADYPDCPNCGEHHDYGQNPGDPLVCYNCGESPGDEIAEAVHDEWARILGGDADAE